MASMRTSLRRLATTGCVLALLASTGAHAQDLKIGFVNMQQVIEQAPQSQAVMTALREEFSPRQRELVQMQTDLQEKREVYQRDSEVMGEQERLALEREITQEARDLQRADQELREDFNIRQNEELSTLQRQLLQRVQAFADREGFDVLLADALFVSDAVDVTADVVAAIKSGGN